MNTKCKISGQVRGHLVSAGQSYKQWRPLSVDYTSNTYMQEGATALAKLLQGSLDGKSYKIGGMYIEFENNGGAAVTPPTFDRAGGTSYYAALVSNANRDYLRVPLTATELSSSDIAIYPGGNVLTCFARTAGTTGVHGKPFSSAQQSRVYGGALVITPQFNDSSQDLVLARFYWASATNQVIKGTGSQIGLEWPFTLQ